MVARCKCGLNWNISIKTDLSKPYVCPHCESKARGIQYKPTKLERGMRI